jgi:hypothetical protein
MCCFILENAQLIIYPAQTSARVVKRLKESGLVVIQSGKFFGDFPFSCIFKIQNQHTKKRIDSDNVLMQLYLISLEQPLQKILVMFFFFSDQIYIGNKQCFTVEVSWSLRSNFLYYLTKQ